MIKKKRQKQADDWVHQLLNKDYDDSTPLRTAKTRAH